MQDVQHQVVTRLEDQERLPLTKRLPVVALIIAMGALFYLRLPIVGEHFGFSADAGSYLMTKWLVLGQDNVGVNPMHFRPPLIGIILIPVTFAFGDLEGSKLLAILSSVLIAVPVYAICRERGARPWLALLAGVGAAIQPAMGGMTTGGYLSMLAAIPLLLGLHWLDCAMRSRAIAELWARPVVRESRRLTRRYVIQAAICAFLVAGLNQTMATLFVVGVGIVTALNLWRAWFITYSDMWPQILVPLLVGLPMALWLPWLIPALASGYSYTEDPFLWVAVAPGAYVAIWVSLVVIPWRPMWGLLTLIFAVMALFGSNNIALNNVLHRAGVWTPIFLTIGAALLVEAGRARLGQKWQKATALGGIAVIVPVLVFGNTLWMQSARATADGVEMLTVDQIAAIEWVGSNTEPKEIVYGHPAGMLWWVGGLENRKWIAAWHVPPVVAVEQQEDWYCAMGWSSDCNPYALREKYGVSVLMFDTSNWQTIRNAPVPGEWNFDRPWFKEVARFGYVYVERWNG